MERIRRMVRPPRNFLDKFTGAFESRLDDPPFHGEVFERSFKVSRVIRYRNSFLPVVEGVIERGPTGTTVRVTMRLHAFAIVFMLVWCGALGFALFTTRQPIPGAMLAFGIIAMCAAFYPEARKAENLLRKALS